MLLDVAAVVVLMFAFYKKMNCFNKMLAPSTTCSVFILKKKIDIKCIHAIFDDLKKKLYMKKKIWYVFAISYNIAYKCWY